MKRSRIEQYKALPVIKKLLEFINGGGPDDSNSKRVRNSLLRSVDAVVEYNRMLDLFRNGTNELSRREVMVQADRLYESVTRNVNEAMEGCEICCGE